MHYSDPDDAERLSLDSRIRCADMIAGRQILLLNYEYPPLGGGAGVATAALARRLAGRGGAVDVVTSSPADSDRRSPDPRRAASASSDAGPRVFGVRSWRQGVHESGLTGAATYVLSALPLVARLLRERDYDLVHIFFSLPTGLLLPLASLEGVPTVVSLRGSDVPGYDQRNRRLQRLHRFLLPVTRCIWRSADRVVALGEALAEKASATDPGLEMTVIPNGVDTDKFRPEPVSLQTGDEGTVRCIAVARLVPRKGIDDLLHAWSRLPRGDYCLDVVGDGPDGQRLRSLAGELGVDDEVSFTGALEHDELARRLRQADLFTLAPHSESFGNVFAEALASGVPIVGTRVGGIPRIVEHGRNGLLVRPGRPAELAEAIAELGSRPRLRERIARRNRERAVSDFTWSEMADDYVNVYDRVLEDRQETASVAAAHPARSTP